MPNNPTSPAADAHLRLGGPFFDDLRVRQSFTSGGLTLTDGVVATHRAIVGDRTPIALDAHLAAQVITGTQRPVVHPALVWDVVIGQSTQFSQRAKANLFYRGLALRRLPEIGDTLYTRTEVVALRENARKEGRFPTGMVALRITAVDQHDREVLDFARCAMLPMSRDDVTTKHSDDMSVVGQALDESELRAVVDSWQLAAHPTGPKVSAGELIPRGHGDVVTSAPELARMTLNLAAVHHDRRAVGARRLVYGGHTVGLANAQLAKSLPHLVAVIGWTGCDHLGPVYEDDTLYSTITVERTADLPGGGQLVHLRSQVSRADGAEVSDVLDWRAVAVLSVPL